MGMFVRRTADLSVNLLTDQEYQALKGLCPHDVEVSAATWAAFFGLVLQRPILEAQVPALVSEYNSRLREEYR